MNCLPGDCWPDEVIRIISCEDDSEHRWLDRNVKELCSLAHSLDLKRLVVLSAIYCASLGFSGPSWKANAKPLQNECSEETDMSQFRCHVDNHM
jgi:hypothetical protein